MRTLTPARRRPAHRGTPRRAARCHHHRRGRGTELGPRGPVLHVQRVAQPRRRRPAGQRPLDAGTTSRRRTSPRPSSGCGRTCCWSTSSTTRPEAVDLFRDNYLEVSQNGAPPIDYPYAYIAPSNTGVPSGFDLNNNGSVGAPGTRPAATTRSASGSSRASTAWSSTRSTPSTPTASAPSSTSCGRTCRARCCRTTRPPRSPPTGTPPRSWRSSALLQVALGRADRRDRLQDRALPGLAPDAAGLRRARGPQRHAQPRRDPVLGRLRLARSRRTSSYIYDDAGRDGGLPPGPSVRDRRRPELRPARRRLGRRVRPSSSSTTRGSTTPRPRSPPAASEAAAVQGAANADPPVATRASTPPTSTTGCAAARATCAPTTSCPRAASRSSVGHLLADRGPDPLLLPDRRIFPFVPTSDHRQVWVDLRCLRR